MDLQQVTNVLANYRTFKEGNMKVVDVGFMLDKNSLNIVLES